MATHQLFHLHGNLIDVHAQIATEVDEVRTLVIFVHGFLGSSDTTWNDFPMLISRSSDLEWIHSDIFFIEYASMDRSVGNAAWDLMLFLETFLENPGSYVQNWTRSPLLANLRPDLSYGYKQLVLVGHSMGGVVIRKTIVDFLRRPFNGSVSTCDTLIRNAKVLLFAPAIGGIQLSGAKGILSETPGLRALVNMFTGKTSSIADLKQGSEFLRALRESTEYMSRQNQPAASISASIAWAENDDAIVNFCGYSHDADQVRILKSSHRSICKPQGLSDEQYIFVRSRLD